MIRLSNLDGIRPINNQILLKKDPIYDEDEKVTESGLIILNKEKPKDRHALATIIKLGDRMKMPDGRYTKLSDIWSEGDRVMYYVPAQGVPVMIGEEEYFLIRAEDVLQAVIQE